MNALQWKLKRQLKTLNLGYAVPLPLEEKLARLPHEATWTTIELPVADQPNDVEEVLVEETAPGHFRILSSPGMIQGLAASDVIALDAKAPRGFQILRRGQNVSIHVFCKAEQREEIKAGLTQVLGRIGGVLDATMGETGLCYTVPVAAGFQVIEGALQRVVGEEWSYSNVYDPDTNELLNWWLKPSKD